MGREGEFIFRNGDRKTQIRSKEKGSDDSDEDFVLGEEDSERSEESSHLSSLVASEESFGLGGATSCSSEDEVKVLKSKPRKPLSDPRKPRVKRSKRKRRVFRVSDDDEEDYDSDDEDFFPDEDDYVTDNKQILSRRKKSRVQIQKRVVQKKPPSKSQKPKKNSKAGRGRSVLSKVISSDDDFTFKEHAKPKQVKKKISHRKKKVVVHSDSDSKDSASSDYEYMISEEEKEFIREAQNRANLRTGLRASLRSKTLLLDAAPHPQERINLERKGKEKVEDLQFDSGKQVCGICLSEEQRRIIRGTLNCCFHYFCFTCIMEWSKVESRCPLCKQRFATISKESRSDIGISLRKTVINIPQRDQVYQPSEAEMLSYLNPYENLLCIECQQGGDDELMLLCDICDSPTHTYCAGLGREVPEGNWYCEACKVSALASSNPLVADSVPEHGTSNNVLHTEPLVQRMNAEGLDLNMSYNTTPQRLPEHFSCRTDSLPSRNLVREALDGAEMFGARVETVSRRRRLRLRIHTLISSSRVSQIHEVPNANLESPVSNSEIGQARTLESGNVCFAAVESGIPRTDRSSGVPCGGLNLGMIEDAKNM